MFAAAHRWNLCLGPWRSHFASVPVLPLRGVDFKVVVVVKAVAVLLRLQDPLRSARGENVCAHSFLKRKTLRVMSAELPVFPAGSPLPYTGCSFSPAGCPPSAGPPGLWPLPGQRRALEPAPLLRRRRWQPGGKKQRSEGFHI